MVSDKNLPFFGISRLFIGPRRLDGFNPLQELLGRLGMIPIKKDTSEEEQKRFSLSYLNSKDFF